MVRSTNLGCYSLMTRSIATHYADPLDLVWLQAARAVGWRVVRDGEVYASFDGEGTLRIGAAETLDPDDSLAQMILHEMCHALVEGPGGWNRPDWGLEFGRPEDEVRERAALRLQAALASPWGLRTFLAATTVYRADYDRLPPDPLADDGDPACRWAQAAALRAAAEPWRSALQNALRRTADLAALVAPCAPADSLWSTAQVLTPRLEND